MTTEVVAAVAKFRSTVSGCLAFRPPGKVRQAVESMQRNVATIEARLGQSPSPRESDVDQFVDVISQADKKLTKLLKFLKTKRQPEVAIVDSLSKAVRDVESIRYRLTGTDGGNLPAAIIRNEAARKFWTTAFGTKVMQVDWSRWAAAYGEEFESDPRLRLNQEQNNIVQWMMAFAGGKFVAAAKLDEMCNLFGFPFEGVKCCKEKNCDCLAFQARRIMHQGSFDSDPGSPTILCTNCSHVKDKHLVLVKLDVRMSFSGGNLVQGTKSIMKRESGLTRLQRRILQNDVELVMKELSEIVDINMTDDNGQTALHSAAAFGSENIVQLLLTYGAQWKVFDKNGLAPIHEAARRGNLPAVRTLVEKDKANIILIDQTDAKSSPLHHASEENRTAVIRFLARLDNAMVNYLNNVGESAVFTAAGNDNAESLDAAAEVGADLKIRNIFDEAPLDVAARSGASESILTIARRIPEAIHGEDEDGNQPLSKAIDADCVNLLAKLGADVNHKNREGQTALHFTAADPSRDEATRALLKIGADGNVADEDGRTPLIIASSKNLTSTVDVILESVDIDTDVQDNEGNTALLVALDSQFEEIAGKLLDAEVDLSLPNQKGLTPLHLCCKHGYEKLTKRLIDLGVLIDSTSQDGKTPLHYAVMKDISIAEMLVEKGANLYQRDAAGDTALALSHRQGTPLKQLSKEEIELLDFSEATKEDLLAEPGPTCPSKSFADGPGLTEELMHVNVRYTFTVFACDNEGHLRTEGNDKLRVVVRGGRKIYEAFVEEKVEKALVVRKIPESGMYAVAYELAEGGDYEIHLTIDGEPIQGSPYKIEVLNAQPPPPPVVLRTHYTNHPYNREVVAFAQSEGVGQVDVAIVCDTTSSMDSEIARAQQLMQDLVDSVREQDLCVDLRIAVIAFRDHPPEEITYVTKVWPLTENVSSVKDAINSLEAFGGGDTPEAVADALHEVYQLNWDEEKRPHAVRIAVLIGDAPPHGMSGLPYDGFPDGCPAGHEWLINAQKCGNKNISIFTVHCRRNPYGERAFAQIATSSGGLSTKIGDNNGEIINLVKLYVQVQLDVQLTGSKVSDVITTTTFPDATFDQRVDRVTETLERMNFHVRRLNTEGGSASVKSRRIAREDVTKAVDSFRLYQRLMSISRNRAMTDNLGKKLFALKKIMRGTPTGNGVATVANGRATTTRAMNGKVN
eukprot:m.20144 g.20144  ORF g.20144 m.20144 type:complete len:1195 (+) comp27979_c0_seq4:16-3600(+)